MIFVVCGTQKFQLNRLLEALDELKGNGQITEEIFAQIGTCDYEPKHYRWERFLQSEAFDEYIKNCDVLLTHSGIGTILAGKENHKPVLVFPRSRKYQEHVDDHQWQIARMFEQHRYVLVCENPGELKEKLELCRTFSFEDVCENENAITDVVRAYLKERFEGKRSRQKRREKTT